MIGMDVNSQVLKFNRRSDARGMDTGGCIYFGGPRPSPLATLPPPFLGLRQRCTLFAFPCVRVLECNADADADVFELRLCFLVSAFRVGDRTVYGSVYRQCEYCA